METALLATCSLPAYERLRDLCEVEHDNPICKVMKAQLSLLANDISDSLIHLKAFNDLLDVCVEVDQWNGGGKEVAKGEVKSAITTYVWFLRMQLDYKKRRASGAEYEASKAELKVRQEISRIALAATRRACSLLIQCNMPLPVAAALGMRDGETDYLEAAKSLQVKDVEQFKSRQSPPVKKDWFNSLLDSMFNRDAKLLEAIRLSDEYEDAVNEFVSLMASVIKKLERYSERIGKSVKISEMIRDYAESLREFELRHVTKPEPPIAPKRRVAFHWPSIIGEGSRNTIVTMVCVAAFCYCFNCFIGFVSRLLIAVFAILVPIALYKSVKHIRAILMDIKNFKEKKAQYDVAMKQYQDVTLPEFEIQKKKVEEVFAWRLGVARSFDL